MSDNLIKDLRSNARMVYFAAEEVVADALSARSSEAADHIESLEAQLEKCRKDAASKQAQIDELMLEFCPDEMLAEQREEWAAHQKKAGAEHEAALIAALSQEKANG